MLTNTGAPEIAGSFELHLMAARANARALLVFGLSDSIWPPFSLPMDFGPFGAPGCWLRASGDLQLPINTDARGSATVRGGVPNQQSLVGIEFFNQFVVFDPQANPGGVAMSDAGRGVVGR